MDWFDVGSSQFFDVPNIINIDIARVVVVFSENLNLDQGPEYYTSVLLPFPVEGFMYCRVNFNVGPPQPK